MPNRDPMKCEEPAGRPARREGSGQGRRAEDTTAGRAHDRAVSSTPEGRKSGWVRLADAIAGADPIVREVLEAGRNVDAEPGDGVAAFLPGGETLLLLATPDGLLVRRNVPADEVALFLGRGEVAA